MADSNWFTRLMSGSDSEGDVGTEGLGDPGSDDRQPDMVVTDAAEASPDDQSADDQRVAELEHRIDRLEERLDDQDATLETVRHSQDDVADRVDDLNDTVREVLGIYDRLVAESNPFVTGETGDDEAFGLLDDEGAASASAAAGGVGDHESPSPADSSEESAEPAEPADPSSASNGQGDDVVGFEDIVGESSADETREESHDRSEEAHDRGHASHDDPANTAGGEPVPAGHSEPAGSDAYLTSIDGSYAVDTIVFEWFGELIEAAGPSETLRAIGYYEDIGWIDGEVAGTLETYLGGPSLDVHVDPSTPTELTAEDHAQSYQYIRKLAAVQSLTEDTS
jgi:archaellum component FlaD/FlaE